MKVRINVAKAFVVFVVLLGVITFPTNLSASHSWNGYHWARTSNPFSLRTGDNVTSAWDSYLNTAISDWSKSTVLDLVKEAGLSNKRCAAVSGTIQVCNNTYGNNGWLGLASISVTGGTHITQGTAKMNDTYFNSSTYNNPNERLHVMCQEVGHTFGLDHQSTDGSSQNTCMDYFSNTGANAGSTISTHPNSHDYDELLTIYNHLDSSTTIGMLVQRGNPYVDEDAPENWGRLVSQSANGRSSTYERENWDGTKKVTHVFWTIEASELCPACDHRYDR